MHDKHGDELHAGDEVIVRCKVTELYAEPDFCNANLETVERMPGNDAPSFLTLNTRQTEKVYGDQSATHDFGWALQQLRQGKRLRRANWNGKGMWIEMQRPDENSKMTLPYVYIEYPAKHPAYPYGSRVPWLASQTDMLSEDWEVFE
jgi:hypothetical protein